MTVLPPTPVPPAGPRWVAASTLVVTAAAMVAKGRRARGATDPLVHADMIVGSAAFLVAAVKAMRVARR